MHVASISFVSFTDVNVRFLPSLLPAAMPLVEKVGLVDYYILVTGIKAVKKLYQMMVLRRF